MCTGRLPSSGQFILLHHKGCQDVIFNKEGSGRTIPPSANGPRGLGAAE